MIELAFDESPAGALKFAKSMKTGDRMQGAVGIIGGTSKERAKLRREAKKPRFWTGVNMEGGSADVAMLKLDLDIGDIAGTAVGAGQRRDVLETLYGDYPGVPAAIWDTNERGLARLDEAKATGEPVRLWVSEASPADQCGLCFVCCLMGDSKTPLSVVRAPRQVEREADSCVIEYRGMGDIPPEEYGALAQTAQPLTALQRRFHAGRWRELVSENAPLRAIVNGRLMSVGEDFYDFSLRQSMPEGEFVMAKLIGLALGGLPGVSDRWLYGRVQAMIAAGELLEVTPPTGDHPYSAVLRRRNVIETERLILREMIPEDFPALCRILQDGEVMYAYEGAFSDGEVHAWLDKQFKNYRDYGFGLWAVVLKETGEMIGQCGLTMQQYNDRSVPEVGYLFQKAYWHCGYASEAAIACRDYAFNKLDIREVYSIIRDTNIPSQNVAKRNGMTCVSRFVKHYRDVDMPHLVFSVKRPDDGLAVKEE